MLPGPDGTGVVSSPTIYTLCSVHQLILYRARDLLGAYALACMLAGQENL